MRNTILTLVLTTLVLDPLSTSFAYAHGPDGPRWEGGPHTDRGPGTQWNRGLGPGAYGDRGAGGPRWDHGPRPERWHRGDRGDRFVWRGYDFHPGYPIPGPFREDRYWVRDWYGYGLPSPPPGHQWRYVDGNFVLIAVATGVITSIILNNAFR